MEYFITRRFSWNSLTRAYFCLVIFVWIVVDVVDSDVSSDQSMNYLVQFGYLKAQDSKVGDLRTEESVTQAFKRFQKMAGIPATGKLDNATKFMMSLPRCGNKDSVRLGVGARRKRYALQGSKWAKRELTFKISEYPRGLPKDAAEREVSNALKVWGDVAPLNFILRPYDDRVDIDVRFARRHHGDGNPFDGRGHTLAHAFFPQYGGDAHFDDDENWTINMTSGVNMLQVAAHEFGHSLGLSHSDVSVAIMAPFYRGYKKHFKLHLDDIKAIQELYGPLTRQTPDPHTSKRPPTRGPVLSLPKICMDSKVDAVTMSSDGHTYVFKGTQYYRLNSYGIADGYPRDISKDWEGITGPIDSALYWDNGFTYIFKGHHYWKFYNFKLVYLRKISDGFKGIPGNIDASFVWGGNGKTYFIKGNQYWRYTVNNVDPGYPRPMSIWTGLPSHIDAALKWNNGRTYFFSDDLYYRFNDVDFKIDKGYPRTIANWWLGCPDKEQINEIIGNLANSETDFEESSQIISQSENETAESFHDGEVHSEGDIYSEQFLSVEEGREAGTMDFLHEDDNSSGNILTRHDIASILMFIVIITSFILHHVS